MAELPTRYYVQRAQSYSTYGPPQGWDTVIVTFDRATADGYASDFERAVVFEEGEDISGKTVTLARVVTAEELRAESEDALVAAEFQTRSQFWQILAAWAEPLVAPNQA